MKSFSFFSLLLVSFLVMNLPKSWREGLRYHTVHLLSSLPISPSPKTPSSEPVSHLVLENQQLKEKVEALYEWLLFDSRLDEQTEKIQKLQTKQEGESLLYWKEFFQRRSEEAKKILEMQLQSLLAKVVYREPASWNSCLWLNVGEKNNELLGRTIVAKNSPVLWGPYLVGIIEYVGPYKSRVRLITDRSLIPSVRAIRGNLQEAECIHMSEAFLQKIESLPQISEEIKQQVQQDIERIKGSLSTEKDFFLAKGELRGSPDPLWYSSLPLLKGVGFNYQYEDAEKKGHPQFPEKNLLQKGDLLITTGLDGVFPAGLPVAYVSHVFPQAEENPIYEIEAKPCAYPMNRLSYLYVMPPLDVSNS